MRDWINARQDGINEAKAQYGTAGVQVYHFCEVNAVKDAIETAAGSSNILTMTNDVVPETYCDLYSYTPYDYGINRNHVNVTQALNYLGAKAPNSAAFGKWNLFLGEDVHDVNVVQGGSDELAKERLRRDFEAAIGWGSRYVFFWALYGLAVCGASHPPPCEYNPALWDPNTITARDTRPTSNNQMQGNGLIRPDGTAYAAKSYMESLIAKSYLRVGLRTASGHFVSADDAGGGLVHVNAPWLREWEYFTIIDHNGGQLMHEDVISILTQGGYYVSAIDNGGGAVYANAPHSLAWELFTVRKVSGTGVISYGDQVSLQAGSGHYFVAEGGGGGTNVLNANRTVASFWEWFRLEQPISDTSFPSPTNVVATATGTNSVSIIWSGVMGATQYRVYRASVHGSFGALVGSTASTSFTDNTATANTAYEYVITAGDGVTFSVFSDDDIATTVVFTDSTPIAEATPVKLAHFTELLTAVNALRTLAGLGAVVFSSPAPSVDVAILKAHLDDLRNGLASARGILGLSTTFGETIIAGTTTIKVAHINELRDGVK